MSLVFRADADGPGVFLLTKHGPKRVACVPPGEEPTSEQMIRLETSWFTSAAYPEPIPAARYHKAIGPHAQRMVPRDLAGGRIGSADLEFAALPPVKPWDVEP